MNFELQAKNRLLNEALKHAYSGDQVKGVYTPFETLGAEMISKIPDVSGDILVLSDAGLLVSLLRRLQAEGLSSGRVLFIAHTEEVQQFVLGLGVQSTLVGYNKIQSWLKEDMKFNIIIGNPPYQEINKGAGAGGSLWSKFVSFGYEALEADGYMSFVTPSSWMRNGSRVPEAFKNGTVRILDPECSVFFPGVGSTFCWYQIQKSDRRGQTKIVGAESFELELDLLPFIPQPLTKLNVSILTKVLTSDGFISLPSGVNPKVGYNKSIDTISKSQTDVHIYKLHHTNAQTLWASTKSDTFDLPKIIWTLSGNYIPVLSYGGIAGSDLTQEIIIDITELSGAMSYMSSNLVKYIVSKACKYSGFMSARVFMALPKVPFDKVYSNADLYAYFNLDQDEIDLIEAATK